MLLRSDILAISNSLNTYFMLAQYGMTYIVR